MLGIAIFGSTYTWYLSLPLTSVAGNSAVYQSAPVFVFLFSVPLLGESVTVLKVGRSLEPPPEDSGSSRLLTLDWPWGDTLAPHGPRRCHNDQNEPRAAHGRVSIAGPREPPVRPRI